MRATTIQNKHYLAVYTNEATGEFALCSVSEPTNLFYGVFSDDTDNRETVHSLQDWLEQFDSERSPRYFVAAQVCRETAFFERYAPYNPLPVFWIDVISYLQGFISGTDRDETLMYELTPYVTPENVKTEVVHQATLWRLVHGLPGTYGELWKEMRLRHELLREWRKKKEESLTIVRAL